MHHVSVPVSRLLFAGFAVLSFAASAGAQVLYESGFERAEGYSPGRLAGQGGWGTSNNGTQPFDVVAGLPGTGSQGVRLRGGDVPITGNDIDGAYAAPVTSANTYSFAQYPVLEYGIDLRLDGPDTGDFPTESDFFNTGLELYGQTPTTAASFFSTLAYDSSGDIYGSGDSAGEPTSVPFRPYVAGDWNHLVLRLDSRTSTSEFFVNGELIGSLDFLFGSRPTDVSGGISVIVTANVDRSKYDVYFDNYSVTAVPEPASLGLLAGGLFLLRRRTAR